MSYLRYFLILFLVGFVFGTKKTIEDEGNFRKISIESLESIEEFIEQKPEVAVLICNDPQTLCQGLIPVWNHILQHDFEITFDNWEEIGVGVIDLLEEQDTPLPSIIPSSDDGYVYWYQDGKLVRELKFVGGHNRDFFVDWMKNNMKRSLDFIDSKEMAEIVTTDCYNYGYAIVLYHPEENSSIEKKLLEVSRIYSSEILFLSIHDFSIIENIFTSSSTPKLVAYRCKDQQEPIEIEYNEDDNVDSLKKKVLQYSLPNFGIISLTNIERGKLLYGLTVLVGLEEKDIPSFAEWANTLHNAQIAYDLYDKVKYGFEVAGASGNIWPTAIALKGSEWPIPFDESIPCNFETLEKFIQQVHDDTYTKFKKSGPIPDYSLYEEGSIVPVVFDNFQEMVIESTRPTLVLYTIESRRGKSFLASAHDLLERIETYLKYYERNVQLVTYDAEKNYNPEEFIAAPQMILYYNGEIHTYTNKATLRDFSSWINELLPEERDEL